MKAEQPGKAPRHLEYTLGLTAFAAGAVDIISFAKLGGSLASAMTGNLALIGLYLARGSVAAAMGSISALCGFIIGAALGTRLTHQLARETSLKLLLGSQMVLLLIFGFLWFLLPHGQTGRNVCLLVSLLAISSGLQSIIGKKINLSNIPTVVFTSTLTNIVIGLTEMLVRGSRQIPPDTTRQATSFLLYFCGAFSAGILVYIDSICLIGLPLVSIAAAVLVQFRPELW